MAINEFDRNRWNSIFEPEPDIASFSAESSIRSGRANAKLITLNLERERLSLPPNARYLALAAGQGYTELAVAASLGISPCNITFVDKRFRSENLHRLRQDFPAVRLVEQGMFAYLANPDQTEFSLLTAFGVEYVLDDNLAMEAFIKLAPRVLRPKAIVDVVRRYDHSLNAIWQQHGFRQLEENSSTFYLCVFDPVRG